MASTRSTVQTLRKLSSSASRSVCRECRRGTSAKAPHISTPSPLNARRAVQSSVPTSRAALHGSARQLSANIAPKPDFFDDAHLGRTALYDLHLAHGGKMVPFGGFEMPVQYSDLGVGESHKWTREKASLFDVGHMVQYHFEGPGAEEFLESITPASVKDLQPGQSSLSALLHPETGGIADDCIITRLENGPKHLFYVVLNAGCRQKDYDFLSSAIDNWDRAAHPVVQLRNLQADGKPYGLIALQGPMAAEILSESLAEACKVDVTKWWFGNAKTITLALANGESLPVVASRGGYTGEDGFELSIHPAQTVAVAQKLLEVGGKDRLRWAGLGARDSLRLEAGMCLYGHDLDDTTTPVEAALSWIIGKGRRESASFNGAKTIMPQLTTRSKGGAGVSRRRVGFIVEGAPAREGAGIVDSEGRSIGKITSGCPSPTLKRNIAMGYIQDGLHKAGTEVGIMVRGKERKAVVAKMPFIETKYWKER